MPLYRYIVFDVETPNRYNDRMSAIGISVIEDGDITEEFFTYVDPEAPFDRFNTQLTGIDEKTVYGAPTFPELWEIIEPKMSSGTAGMRRADDRVYRALGFLATLFPPFSADLTLPRQ